MSSPSVPAERFAVHHVQLARAGAAAIAALMITFSSDHSAAVGLSVFSGFGILTAIVFFLAAWLTYPAGRRWAPLSLGAVAVIAGMIAGIGPWRTSTTFFVLVIAWAFVSGALELLSGLRERRADAARRGQARDAVTVGILTLVLGAAMLVIPAQYVLEYTIDEAGTFTLTGTTIAVGVFSGYAAIVAVYLAIAAFSPRPQAAGEADAVAPAPEEGTA